MRIIAGKARRLPLRSLEGKDTRPTTDRIKETLFNMLNGELDNAYFLDLFAGTGQIGLEAVSRGANYCVFVENNKKACEVIQDNIDFTKLGTQCQLLSMDVAAAIRSLEGKYTFDVIFMDPPYDMGYERHILEQLSTSSILKPRTLFVVEAALDTDFSYVEQMGYRILKEKEYKSNKHVFLERVNQ